MEGKGPEAGDGGGGDVAEGGAVSIYNRGKGVGMYRDRLGRAGKRMAHTGPYLPAGYVQLHAMSSNLHGGVTRGRLCLSKDASTPEQRLASAELRIIEK